MTMKKYIIDLPPSKPLFQEQAEAVISLPSPQIDPELTALKALLAGKQPDMFCIYSNNQDRYFDNHTGQTLIMLKVKYRASMLKPLGWFNDIINQNHDQNRWFTDNVITDITAISITEGYSENVTQLIKANRGAEIHVIHDYRGKENQIFVNNSASPSPSGSAR